MENTKTHPFQDVSSHHHQFEAELAQAILNGYDHHFRVHPNGLLYCLSNLDKHYSLKEVHLKVITCPAIRASLYLITTLDGLYKGTMVDYYEH